MSAGSMRFISQSPKVATNAVILSIPTDDQTKIANSPRANILKNPGNGIPVCIRYMPEMLLNIVNLSNLIPKNNIKRRY